jgi:hypothetical protein
MSVKQEACTNPEVVKAIEDLFKGLPNPVTHGEFNRHMFLETIVVKGGGGISMDKESIMGYACLTEREFDTIKIELIIKGIIKEENNPMVGEPLYSLQLTPKEEAI